MKLLSLSPTETEKLIEQMESENENLENNLYNMVWHMRGGINLEQIYQMSFRQLEKINKIIEEHMETTGKSGLPFF
jgi:hypothetical protein